VGILGAGSSGLGGSNNSSILTAAIGGSGGAKGKIGYSNNTAVYRIDTAGGGTGLYGGGASPRLGNGSNGAIRIIWPTASYPTRAFPSTNAGQV
jgi:hypothetical protein